MAKQTELAVFQSPCGEVVVKRKYPELIVNESISMVSVPLRGSGCETVPLQTIVERVETGFSPLAGKWL